MDAFPDLKPYSEYQDTSAEWLGAIPIHWRAMPNRAVFEEIKSQGHPNEPMLSVTITRGIVRQSDLLSETSKKDSSNLDRSKYKLVVPDDIAYNKMRAWQGAFGVSKYRGIISPAYVVQRLRAEGVPDYFHHLFRTPGFAKEAEKWSYGITSDMWSLRPEHFKVIYVPVPPPDEQSAIVRFLAAFDRRVNRFVRAKRRLIELLSEQKQGIITHAVTRGLNPNAKLKPSGIDWLGDMPENWSVKPFVRCAIERADYRGATPEKVESGVYLVTAKNIRKGWIDYETSKEYVRADQYEKIMRRGLPEKDDILFTTEAPLGNVALVDRQDIALAQRIIRFRLDREVLRPKFALGAMLSRYFQIQLEQRATGSTASGIKASKLPQLQVVVPPSTEQDEIVDWIDKNTSRIDNLVVHAQNEITLIREYRTKLVADIVTGKLDITGVVSKSELDDVRDGDAITEAGEDDTYADFDDEEAAEEAGDEVAVGEE